MKFTHKLIRYSKQQLVGIALFFAAHYVATIERGYEAIGGEIFFLFLPLFIWMAKSCVKDILSDFRKGRRRDYE